MHPVTTARTARAVWHSPRKPAGTMVQVEVMAMKTQTIFEPGVSEALTELLAEDGLAPPIARRVRALLRDLAQNDVEMTMLDLAQLSRAVMGAEESAANAVDLPGPVAILGADASALGGVCYGPKVDGCCPWAGQDGTLPCDGAWLAAAGWQFKVAEDAKEICPLGAVLAKAG